MAQFAALYNVNIGSGSAPVPPTPDPTPVYFNDNLKTVSIYDTDGNLVNKVVGNPGDEVLIATDTSTYYGPVQITRTQGTVDTSVYLSTLTMPKYDIDVVKDVFVTGEWGYSVNVQATVVLSSASQTVTFDQLGWRTSGTQRKIFWGDGNVDSNISADTTSVSHTYTDAGTYVIQIMGLISYDFGNFSAIGSVTKLELASEGAQTDFKLSSGASLKSLTISGTKTRILQNSTSRQIAAPNIEFIAFANVNDSLFTDGDTTAALVQSIKLKHIIYPYGYNGIMLEPESAYHLNKLIFPAGFTGDVKKQDFYGKIVYGGAKSGPCDIGKMYVETAKPTSSVNTYNRQICNYNIEEIYGDDVIYLATQTASDSAINYFQPSSIGTNSVNAYDSSEVLSLTNNLKNIDAPNGVGLADNSTACSRLASCINLSNWVYKPHATLTKTNGTYDIMMFFTGIMPKAYDLTAIHDTTGWWKGTQLFTSITYNPDFHVVCSADDYSAWQYWMPTSYRAYVTTDTSYLN